MHELSIALGIVTSVSEIAQSRGYPRIEAVTLRIGKLGLDGAILGRRVFVAGLRAPFERIGHPRSYDLPGGDAAAHFPTLRGFTARISFEGQAAMWLEHAAERATGERGYRFAGDGGMLDCRDALETIAAGTRGRHRSRVDRARLHLGLARGIADAAAKDALNIVALSGGVWQNRLLFAATVRFLRARGLRVISHRNVPVNVGGTSLGQAALAAYAAPGTASAHGRSSDASRTTVET